jgi:hypothetical protein
MGELKEMNLFSSNADAKPSFDEAYEQFCRELGLDYRYNKLRCKAFDKYLLELFSQGNLLHNPDLDKLVKESFSSYQEEFDVKYSNCWAIAKCLEAGADLHKIMTSGSLRAEAVIEAISLDSTVDINLAIDIQKVLNINNEFEKIVKMITGNSYRKKNSYGYTLLTVYNLIKSYPEVQAHLDSWSDNYCLVIIGNYLQEGIAYYEAIQRVDRYKGKKYSWQLAKLMDIKFPNDNVLPKNTDLFEIVAQNEIKYCNSLQELEARFTSLQELLHKDNATITAKDISDVASVYETGFSIGKLMEMYPEIRESIAIQKFISLCKLARSIIDRNSISSSMHRRDTTGLYSEYVFGGEIVKVYKPELLFDLFRHVIDNLSTEAIGNFSKVDYVSYYVENWINGISGTVMCLQDKSEVKAILSRNFSEVQIAYNGRIMNHFPADFFIEYGEEVIFWVKKNRPKYFIIKHEFVTQKSDIDKTADNLVIDFSDNNDLGYVLHECCLGLSVDFATKKRTVLESGYRLGTPYYKILLKNYFKEHGQDYNEIETFDVQTVVGMIQALILQKSSEYEELFKKHDVFVAVMRGLKWCIRNDDNLYSAVVRYALLAAGINSRYTRCRISPTLSSTLVIDDKQYPILQCLTNNNKIIEFLKTNRDFLQIELIGDQIHVKGA